MMTCHDLHSVDQARVVQNVDSAIHWICLYPVKQRNRFPKYLSGG